MSAAVDTLYAMLGGLDVLVNNAGAAELMAEHSRAARARARDVVDPRARVSTAATDILTAPARHILAERVLGVAHRLGNRILGAGHLLLAVLESPDEDVARIVRAVPDTQRIATALMRALPADERT